MVLLAAWMCSLASLRAQLPSGSISGHVLCNDGNVPARNAKVKLVPLDQFLPRSASEKASQASSVETTTDFSGYYQLYSVSPGTYLVNAVMDGYVDDLRWMETVLDHSTAGERKALIASLPQITIKPGSAAALDLILRRAAAISGRLTVDSGGTIGWVPITATLVSGPSADNSTKNNSPSFSGMAFTDDRGVYRIAGLPPGSYRLSVRLTSTFFDANVTSDNQFTLTPQRAGLTELTVYAPEALKESDAKLVKVADGEETTAGDLNIPSRLLHSIGGVVNSGGNPVVGALVDLQRPGLSEPGHEAITLPDGSYRFDMLPSGSYVVIAKLSRSSQAKSGPMSGQANTMLDQNDALDVNIELHPIKTP